MKKIIGFSAVIGSIPLFAFAADAFSIITVINKILATLIPVFITFAVAWFIWGVISYTITADEEKKKKARAAIIQGLVGLFVIVAFWGIIRLITNTFGVGPEQLNSTSIPCIPGPGVIC
jgi:uncharacterized membrane protein